MSKIPVIIYLILSLSGLLFAAYRHGKPKEGTDKFWNAFFAAIIVWSILWWGDFFSPLFN